MKLQKLRRCRIGGLVTMKLVLQSRINMTQPGPGSKFYHFAYTIVILQYTV
jgi:hypothetical protein